MEQELMNEAGDLGDQIAMKRKLIDEKVKRDEAEAKAEQEAKERAD